MGSPPPLGSKKDVFKFRSVSSIVIAPAKTGKDKSSRMAVINTDQTNNGIWSIFIVPVRIFNTVEMKLMAPRIDEAPARCNEKMAESTAPPAWEMFADKGG